MKLCPRCNERFPDDANFCPMDAATLVAAAEAATPAPRESVAVEPLRSEPAQSEPSAPPAAPVDDTLLDGRFRADGSAESSPLGEVFDAYDVRENRAARLIHVGADVFPSPLGLERTQRELRQLEKTPAAGAGRVLGHGRLADGRLWIATAPLPGTSLEEAAQQVGSLPLGRASAIVARIGEALLEAQKGGVIHRDVQPANVRLLADDGVEVVNFGLAVPFDERVFGEPHYISPEQALGKPVDQRSNIYSLAAVLYRLVCGQPPFLGDVASLLAQHETADPVPPSRRRPDAGMALDALIVKAMAKSPTRRHLTLRQFVKDVRDLATADPAAPRALVEPPAARTMMLGAEPNASPPVAVPDVPVVEAAATEPVGDPVAPEAPPVPAATIIAIAPPAEPLPVATAAADVAPAEPAVTAEPAPEVKPPEPATRPPAEPEAPRSGTPRPGAGQFRETLWFAKGEKGSGANGESAPAAVADERPLQDRYLDDGSLAREEAARLSLRAGAKPPVRVPAHVPARRLPGERMDTKGIANEMARGSRRWAVVTVVVVLAIAGAVVAWKLR